VYRGRERVRENELSVTFNQSGARYVWVFGRVSTHPPRTPLRLSDLPNQSPGVLKFYESDVPQLESTTPDGPETNTLVVFDDLVVARDLQGAVSEYFLRGRKKTLRAPVSVSHTTAHRNSPVVSVGTPF
jgi:hypothetical protein